MARAPSAKDCRSSSFAKSTGRHRRCGTASRLRVWCQRQTEGATIQLRMGGLPESPDRGSVRRDTANRSGLLCPGTAVAQAPHPQ